MPTKNNQSEINKLIMIFTDLPSVAEAVACSCHLNTAEVIWKLLEALLQVGLWHGGHEPAQVVASPAEVERASDGRTRRAQFCKGCIVRRETVDEREAG